MTQRPPLQRQPHGRRDARETVLVHEVGDAFGQQILRLLRAQGAGDEDEGNVPAHLTQQVQRFHPVPRRQRVVGEDDVKGLRGKACGKFLGGLHALHPRLESALAQLAAAQLGVRRVVLDQEDINRLRGIRGGFQISHGPDHRRAAAAGNKLWTLARTDSGGHKRGFICKRAELSRGKSRR